MPMQYLLALFIGLPIIELALLIKLHGMVGFMPTILLVVLTGVAGAALVKKQGLATLFNIQREMNLGHLPAPQLMDGIMILMAGAFLVTPGLLTDLTGFALLIPKFRTFIRAWLKKKLEDKIRNGNIQININRP